MEVWKDVVGYEGYYQVSNLGAIRSIDRLVKYPNSKYINGDGVRRFKGKLLIPLINHGGYSQVTLRKEGIQKTHTVHRLVAEAFLPIDINRKHVNHKDGNRSNNVLENLEWCTAKENIQHASSRDMMGRKGEAAHRAKLTNQIVLDMRTLYNNGSVIKDIMKIYKTSYNTTYTVVTKRSWRHI